MKISELKAPAVAGVIREKSVRASNAAIKNCMIDGADMIDLHLSCLEDDSVDALKQIISATKLPILALNYNKTYDWEDCNLSEEERVASFIRAAEAGVAAVDMQGYTFDDASKEGFCGEDKYSFTKGNPKEIVTDSAIISKQCAFIEQMHGMGTEVLLSCHPGIVMNSTQVVELALFLEQRKPNVIKIVTASTCEDDLAECIKAMTMLKKEVKTPVSYHTFGKPGTLSRIINPLLGGQIAFCVDGYTDSSTMEQLDLKTVRSIVDNVNKFFW